MKIIGSAIGIGLLGVALAAPAAEPEAARDARQVEDFVSGKPEKLRPFLRALFIEGERNAVLNLNHLGLAAMELGEWEIAKRAFDQSILRIEAIYADDENARKAKSVWNAEKVKDFKGEPYERAMVYFYRGLLYLRDNEYDNAAASFRAADYQDTQAEQEAFQGDFGVMLYLAAWAQNCRGNGGTAKDLLAQAVSKDASVGGLSIEDRFLVLVDSGVGPQKFGSGRHREVLKFREGRHGKDAALKLAFADGAPLPGELKAVGDVQFQAETRGGRAIDGILDGKAQWKTGSETTGKVATAVGLAAMQAGVSSNNSNMAGIGALGALVGLVANAASAAMNAAADTRTWASLPQAIYLASAPAVPASFSAEVEYESGGEPQSRPVGLLAKGERCAVAWTRTRSALMSYDGGVAAVSTSPKFDDSGREAVNPKFRDTMFQTF